MADHAELVYWTIGLLHEFVIRDIARLELAAVPGIIKIMTNFLNAAEDASIIRIALRTLRYLAHKNGT